MQNAKRAAALFFGVAAFVNSSLAFGAQAQDRVNVVERFNTMNRPIGAEIEGWNIRPVLELRGGYDDNVLVTGQNAVSSSVIQLRGKIESDYHQGPYVVQIGGVLNNFAYIDAPDRNKLEVNAYAELALNLKPTSELRGRISFVEGAETGPDNGIIVNGIFDPYREAGRYFRVPLDAEAEMDFGVTKIESAFHLQAIEHDTQVTKSGLVVNQDFRNGWEADFNVRGTYSPYEVWSIDLKGAAGTCKFEDSRSNTDTWQILFGGTVDLTQLVTVDAYAGYAGQVFENGATAAGFVYGARLQWFASELVSISLDAQREFRAEVETTLSVGTTAFPITQEAVGLRVDWEPLKEMLVQFNAKYARNERDGVVWLQEMSVIELQSTYILTKALRITLGWEYEFGSSTFASRYSRNAMTLGLAASY